MTSGENNENSFYWSKITQKVQKFSLICGHFGLKMHKKIEKCKNYLHNSIEKCNFAAEKMMEKCNNYVVS